MNPAEIHFWDSHAGAGRLILEIRARRQRAVDFFGESAVATENEGQLYRILEAYLILATSDDTLLSDMSFVPEWIVAELRNAPDFEHKETIIEGVPRFTLADMRQIKERARRVLIDNGVESS